MRNGFAGLLSLLITIGIIAFLLGGGWYYGNSLFFSKEKSQSSLQFGKERIKGAEVLQQEIEKQQKKLQMMLDEANQPRGR